MREVYCPYCGHMTLFPANELAYGAQWCEKCNHGFTIINNITKYTVDV